jgi:hypothetical protein
MFKPLLLATLATCSLMACADDASPTEGDRAGDAAVTPADATVPAADAGRYARCAADRASEPRSIAEVVDRLNALPEPTIHCLLASLPRPLSLVASVGVTSLQPAAGADSPRIFIMLEKLTLSVVPTGDGADQLEFGEWFDERNTIKAELRFPLARPVAQELPYHDLVSEGQTVSSCGFCHRNEQAHPSIDGAFVSDALRPAPLNELALDDLRAIRIGCELAEGPHCEMLRALFDYGEVQPGAFDRGLTAGF